MFNVINMLYIVLIYRSLEVSQMTMWYKDEMTAHLSVQTNKKTCSFPIIHVDIWDKMISLNFGKYHFWPCDIKRKIFRIASVRNVVIGHSNEQLDSMDKSIHIS